MQMHERHIPCPQTFFKGSRQLRGVGMWCALAALLRTACSPAAGGLFIIPRWSTATNRNQAAGVVAEHLIEVKYSTSSRDVRWPRLSNPAISITGSNVSAHRRGGSVMSAIQIDPRRDALIIVDVQNDFCPGGAFAVPHGDKVIPAINRLLAYPWLAVATKDWHPSNHSSFQAQGGPWPPHCVQGTPGAELHPALDAASI